jgi:SAM-dependent methyltransferase
MDFERIVKKLTPGPLRKIRRRIRDKKVADEFRGLTTKEVFEKIYRERYWGALPDKSRAFYSGPGSHDGTTVEIYLKAVKEFLSRHRGIKTAADLGCGDFNVGKALYGLFDRYYAVDVAENVVEKNKKRFKSSKVKWLCLSITEDDLPKADIAFLRQVLQHLSNRDIADFLSNIKGKYRFLVVTETQPKTRRYKPNLDIMTGPGVRFHKKSGVDLTKPPFNLKAVSENIICEVAVGKEHIITTVYEV